MNRERAFDDAAPLDEPETLSSDEQALFDRMMNETPDQAGDAPEEPAPAPKPKAPKSGPTAAEASAEEEPDLEEGEAEITIDENGTPRDGDGKFVSKSALLRVKEQNKQYRDQLAQRESENARIMGRMDQLTEILNGLGQPAPKKGEKPDNPWDEADVNPTEDLVGAFDQSQRRAKFERQQREQTQQSMGQRDVEQQTVQAYVQDARRIASEHQSQGLMVTLGEGESAKTIPAFQAAYIHLVTQRHAQLEAVGVTDLAQRQAQIAQEERNLVAQAMANKKSPAEAIFNLAKASGFQMPSKRNGKANDEDEGEGGPTPAQAAATKKLETVAKGMKTAQSLSGKGGQAYSGMTRAQIIAMDEDAFANFTQKLSERELHKLLGADD